jgi:phosphohistidine phosphatase
MKTLLMIRHAKSSWDGARLVDMLRPLNDRGKRDAPEMARRLLKAGVKIDLFVSSPAKRARNTAELFIREYQRNANEIQFIPDLYEASVQAFKEAVAGLDDAMDSVAIFSHNPGITAFVNTLASVRLDDMPTCSVFAVTSPAPTWGEFDDSKKEFLFFDYPKNQ